MGKLYNWHKWDAVDIYEGRGGVAVGNKATGYSVFADKASVDINRDGRVKYKSVSGYTGTYETKREASQLIRDIDKAFSDEEGIVLFELSGDVPPAFSAFSQSDAKMGGSIIVYPRGYTEAFAHELAHFECDHLGKGPPQRTGRRDEQKAIRKEIEILRERSAYSPQARYSLIKHHSTYYRGSSEERLRKAEEFVTSVE